MLIQVFRPNTAANQIGFNWAPSTRRGETRVPEGRGARGDDAAMDERTSASTAAALASPGVCRSRSPSWRGARRSSTAGVSARRGRTAASASGQRCCSFAETPQPGGGSGCTSCSACCRGHSPGPARLRGSPHSVGPAAEPVRLPGQPRVDVSAFRFALARIGRRRVRRRVAAHHALTRPAGRARRWCRARRGASFEQRSEHSCAATSA